MNPNRLIKYVSIGLLSAAIGYLGSQYIHTPSKAWNADVNNDGIEDIVIESRDGKRAVTYGISDSPQKNKDFFSGEKASELFNSRWRKEYKEHWGKNPDYDKFHLETKWEHW